MFSVELSHRSRILGDIFFVNGLLRPTKFLALDQLFNSGDLLVGLLECLLEGGQLLRNVLLARRQSLSRLLKMALVLGDLRQNRIW